MAESWGKAVRRRADWVPLPTPGGEVVSLSVFVLWRGLGGRRMKEEEEGGRTWGADEDDAGCFGELHCGMLFNE